MFRALSRLMMISACLLVMPTFAGVETAVAQSNLPPCPTDQTQRYDNCFGTYTSEDGSKYEGEFKDDKANGTGTYTWANGDKYAGEFKNDKKHGQGTFTFSEGQWKGDKYVGEFMDDTFNGQGTYTFHTGDKYIGNFKDGVPNGEGSLTFSNGNKYFGEFKGWQRNGHGTLVFGNGANHVGEFKDDKANGQGNLTFPNGDKYVGEFKDWKLLGQFTVTYANGDSFSGGYQSDKRSGLGTYSWKDGTEYVGQWKDGLPTTEGILTDRSGTPIKDAQFKSAAVYDADGIMTSPDVLTYSVGNVQQQKDLQLSLAEAALVQSSLPPCPKMQIERYNDCFGTFTFANGEKYVGEFKDDKRHGQGAFTFSDGDTYFGEFKDNLFSGQLSVAYSNGDSFSGDYQSNKRDGQGTYIWKDGTKYVGQWKDGLPTTEGILTDRSGSRIRQVQYKSAAVYDADGYMTSPDVLTYSGGNVQQQVAQVPEQEKPAASNDNGRRLALVVGIDNYQHIGVLQKAVNDSKAISDTLRKIGYDVLSVDNADRRTMSQKLQEFQSKIQPGDTAFFFFAGHGVALGADNILLAADVPSLKPGEDDIAKDEGFSVDNIVRRIQKQGAKTAMLVLDACRNNPFETDGTRSIGNTRGLTKQETPEGVFVLFSAGLGQGALDRLSDNDPDPNSVFTRKLVPALLTPQISHIDLAKQVQSDVAELAATINVKQQPAYYDQIMGKVLMNNLQ